GKIEFGWKTYQEYLEHLNKVFEEIYRITKPGGKVILVLGNSPKISKESHLEFYWPCLHDLLSNCHKFGWQIIDEVVWIQDEPVYEIYSKVAPNSRLKPHHNWISVMEKPGSLSNEIPNKDPHSSVWHIKSEGPISEYNESYGSFPDELIEKCLDLWSVKGDLILDPYAGSGQSIRVAKKMSRNGLGFEIDNKWAHLWTDINA
ncbi:MAG: DNA methyltransferase, partial [Candidatus Kariarchaeaceae archaeon]